METPPGFDRFTDFLTSASRLWALAVEVRDSRKALFSAQQEQTADPLLRRRIQSVTGQVLETGKARQVKGVGGPPVYGAPLRYRGEIAAALVLWPSASARGSAAPPASDDMQQLCAALAGLIEEQWREREEAEDMADELSRSFEDLHMYSTISTQVTALHFTPRMLADLVSQFLDAMRADLAFARLPRRPAYSVEIAARGSSADLPDQATLVDRLVSLIPTGEPSFDDGYFILNDSLASDGFRRLHSDTYRFLAVKIRNRDTFHGWLGLVSFNMKEIFRTGEKKLLISAAYQIAVALENSQLYTETLRLAEQERQIRGVFQKYVPQEVVSEILQLGEKDLIGFGSRRLVTLLNADIRGYSRMSKNVRAEKVVALLNVFFRNLGGVILKHHGLVDKYLGDGLLAIFGAPVESGSSALNAVRAAVEMIESLAAVDQFARELCGVPLQIGISINTGEAILGNIGFDRKMEYTVIGDVVNDTFRLQELTRERPNSILVSESTFRAVEGRVRAEPLGVKSIGSGETRMPVYRVIGLHAEQAGQESRTPTDPDLPPGS